MIEVLSTADPRFTEEHWRAYFECLHILHTRHGATLTATTWSGLRDHLLSVRNHLERYDSLVAFDAGRACAWVSLQVHVAADGEVSGHSQLDSLETERVKDLARSTAPALADTMRRFGCLKAQASAPSPPASQLADAWGARRLNRFDRFRLERRDAPQPTISRWLESYPRRFPHLRLVFFERIPDEYMTDYIELFRQFIAEMPGEREDAVSFTLDADHVRQLERARADAGGHLYTFALVTPENRLVAYTNGYINEHNPRDMYQAMTGVLREHRGHGLSRWLKAALLERVGRDFPSNETITTEMRAVNEPIQKVNADMGFRLLSRGYEYSLELAHLQQIIGDAQPDSRPGG